MAHVQIHATVGSNMTLKKFSEILASRMEYLNESARGSVAACALQVLRSIRTKTKVAKMSGIKPELVAANEYYPSYSTRSNKYRQPCIRMKGSNARYMGDRKVVFAVRPQTGMEKSWHVWYVKDKYSKKKRSYLIAAPSKAIAKATAKKLISRHALRYAGLARRAVSVLMMKTFNKGIADNVPAYVTAKASQVTKKTEAVHQNAQTKDGTYVLTLTDALNYALDALKGGRAEVDIQLKKAMNKIVSVINMKMKDTDKFFGPTKLPTPFPEIVSKRR